MEYQIYILPTKREKFFQHFLSATSEENYLRNYEVFANKITTENRFFNIGITEFAVPLTSELKYDYDFYIVNFMRIKDGTNYYYYNIKGVIKQTQTVILYRVELDEYHTFFNNHGLDYDFKGYLKFSNTRCIEDKDKLFIPPSSSIEDFTYTASPFRYKEGNLSSLAPVLVFKGSISGIHVVTTANDTTSYPYNELSNIAKEGKLKYNHVYFDESGFHTTTKEETIEIIAAYIIPFYFIDSRKTLSEDDYWTATIYQGISPVETINLYEFYAAEKVTQTFDISSYRDNIVEFGTFSSRLKLGVDGRILNINAKLSVLSDNIDIVLWCGTQRLSITKDFECVVSSSALNQYLNSNAITIALKTIAAAGMTMGGVATGNILSAIGGVSSGVSIFNDIYQQQQTTANVYGTSGAELNYHFFGNHLLDPFYVWKYFPKNYSQMHNARILIGGDCQNQPISFELMKSADKTNPTAAYNYYEFTKIVSDYPHANRIAPLLLGGIEMEFIE